MAIDPNGVNQFWQWFQNELGKIEHVFETGDAIALSGIMNAQVKRLHKDLSWEMGPGRKKEYSLTISSASNRSLRPELELVLAAAPNISRWEFYAARQPKEIPPSIELVNRGIKLNPHEWKFCAKAGRERRVDIVILSPILASLPTSDAVSAVFIYLDSALGEDLVEDWIGEIDIRAEASSGSKPFPISSLRQYLLQQG